MDDLTYGVANSSVWYRTYETFNSKLLQIQKLYTYTTIYTLDCNQWTPIMSNWKTQEHRTRIDYTMCIWASCNFKQLDFAIWCNVSKACKRTETESSFSISINKLKVSPANLVDRMMKLNKASHSDNDNTKQRLIHSQHEHA